MAYPLHWASPAWPSRERASLQAAHAGMYAVVLDVGNPCRLDAVGAPTQEAEPDVEREKRTGLSKAASYVPARGGVDVGASGGGGGEGVV